MKNPLCSFLSRLALPGLMSLIFLSPAMSRADTFEINVDFGGGIKGTGSFNTDGSCDPCFAGALQQLDNFVFTVGDDTFTEDEALLNGLLFHRAGNTLESAGTFLGGDSGGDQLGFSPGPPGTTDIQFIDEDTTVGAAAGTISAVPEPTSLALLAGVIAWVVFDLKRRFRKKSVIH
jgi:hypothetical protein